MLERSIILKINDLLKKKKISCLELTQSYLNEIKKSNLNAFITVTEKIAIDSAKKVDKKISKNEEIGLLEGVPVAIKDVISTKGVLTTCGSKMLSNYKPIYDATCFELLKNQGTVLLGKSNQDEFAMGSSNETSFFGNVLNPHDNTRVPGGSSGGSAASVCGGLSAFAIGTDTGGSVRQPASFCGIVGFKPSYGSVSRYGVVPMASSFDQVGTITLTVKDTAIVYDCISKFDAKDSTSYNSKREEVLDSLEKKINGLKIGVLEECMQGIEPEVLKSIENSIDVFKSLGCEISNVSVPEVKYAMPIYYVLMCSEASSNLGRFDGIRYGFRVENYESLEDLIIKNRSDGFGEEVKRRILLGNFILSSEKHNTLYKKAQDLREYLTYKFMEIFESYDIILLPTCPSTAFEFNFAQDDPVKMYLSDICTVTANEIRVPAISIPCGYDKNNLPIGLQLMASRFREDVLLNVAYKYENENFCAKIINGFDPFGIK